LSGHKWHCPERPTWIRKLTPYNVGVLPPSLMRTNYMRDITPKNRNSLCLQKAGLCDGLDPAVATINFVSWQNHWKTRSCDHASFFTSPSRGRNQVVVRALDTPLSYVAQVWGVICRFYSLSNPPLACIYKCQRDRHQEWMDLQRYAHIYLYTHYQLQTMVSMRLWALLSLSSLVVAAKV